MRLKPSRGQQREEQREQAQKKKREVGATELFGKRLRDSESRGKMDNESNLITFFNNGTCKELQFEIQQLGGGIIPVCAACSLGRDILEKNSFDNWRANDIHW